VKVAIVIGSQRPGSRSASVGQYLERELTRLDLEAYVLDLGAVGLPLWDEGCWDEEREGPWNEAWSAASAELTSCDALIVVSPEWGGMATASLKNFFLLCEKNELAHKPALLVGVSSGQGGSYPIAELRMSSYKNTHVCYLPDHLIIRNVRAFLADGPEPALQERVEHTLKLLASYARAFAQLRKDDVVVSWPYAYGM